MELYIGQNLKNLRKAKNLTQEEVAKHRTDNKHLQY